MPLSDAVVQGVRKVLSDEDIEGLIEIGAPRDEYDSEARDLAFRIQQEGMPSEQELLEWLRLIWSRNFNLGHEELAQREECLRVAAERIYSFSQR